MRFDWTAATIGYKALSGWSTLCAAKAQYMNNIRTLYLYIYYRLYNIHKSMYVT